MEQLFNWGAIIDVVNKALDPIIIILVFAGGFFQSAWLKWWNVNSAFKTLIVSTLFTVLYIVFFIMGGTYDRALPVKWFLSYTVATSFYELGLKRLFDWIGGKKDQSTPKQE